MKLKNHINHVVFVLDASASMRGISGALIKAADAEIAHLAKRSKEMDQETRVTVYVFSDANDVRCVIYDMDVLRLPSIRDLYRMGIRTALVDASLLAINDLAMTPEKYGDHAFLIYVMTDGQENDSDAHYTTLRDRIKALPDHWSLGVLVPDERGEIEAARYGFPPNNIAIWDATTERGVEESMSVIRAATENFMEGRSKGIRGTRNIFSSGADAVNAQSIRETGLVPLRASAYRMFNVSVTGPIQQYVETQGLPYRRGTAYYQLTKTETIQPQKALAVVHKVTGEVYSGPQVRDLVGLRPEHVRVTPSFNPDYDIYVQSTSNNRKLLAGTKLLILGV